MNIQDTLKEFEKKLSLFSFEGGFEVDYSHAYGIIYDMDKIEDFLKKALEDTFEEGRKHEARLQSQAGDNYILDVDVKGKKS